MTELPLFPLNTVLYPGIPIYLHIFEERYKQLVHDCMAAEQSFGVVLIKQGVEVGGTAEPFGVGCTARIIRVERLDEGRLNIVAFGQRRFRVQHTSYEQPYLTGQVQIAPLCANDSAEIITSAYQRLQPWIPRYVDVLRQIKDVKFFRDELPDDPVLYAYAAANYLQMPQAQKQTLLEIDSALTLLNTVRSTYRREIAYLRSVVQHADRMRDVEPASNFSMN
jgi:Lon protease-like protein